MRKTIKYCDALNQTEPSDRVLLLGNGFSISIHNKFQYRDILEECRKHIEYNELTDSWIELFNKFHTVNFEEILKNLSIASDVTEHYKEKECSLKISQDKKHILDAFLKTLHTINDEVTKTTASDRNRLVLEFAHNYKNVFTTNYDLILYRVMSDKSGAGFGELNDGFGSSTIDEENKSLIWRAPTQQNFFYLHGALHLFEEYTDFGEAVLIKLRGEERNTIQYQIEKKVQEGIYPLVIFEGDSKNKLKYIQRNMYLNCAYNKLKNISGSLFILGSSLNPDSDKHILDAINKNNSIKEIYVSAYPQDKEKINTAVGYIDNGEKDIYLFDSTEAFTWGSGLVKDSA